MRNYQKDMSQKDIQNTSTNSYGHISNTLVNNDFYGFSTKKTEKLVTALYMVTDCMDTDDALKSKLRLSGVELLSLIFKLSVISPIEKHKEIDISLAKIKEVISFIEIAGTIGFISEMNTSILKREFATLVSELESHKEKDKHFSFILNDKIFDINKEEKVGENMINHPIKDIYNKRTSYNNMPTRPIGVSFINNKSPLQNFEIKRPSHRSDINDREDRINKILSIIKDKSLLKTNEGGVSIKDISLLFPDYSEKTIQRELNTLVLKGKLKKLGSKRWSRYSIVVSSK